MLKSDNYPVYSKRKYSKEFYLSFCHSGTYTSVTCICGRTHFSNEPPLDDESDEQEKQQLKNLASEKPDVYIEHSGSVSHFSSNNQSVVFACDCNYAGFLEGVILEHSRSIISYLKDISLKAKNNADAFRNKVLEL